MNPCSRRRHASACKIQYFKDVTNSKERHLDAPVLVDKQVGRLEVAVDDGRVGGVEVVHALGRVQPHAQPPLPGHQRRQLCARLLLLMRLRPESADAQSCASLMLIHPSTALPLRSSLQEMSCRLKLADGILMRLSTCFFNLYHAQKQQA